MDSHRQSLETGERIGNVGRYVYSGRIFTALRFRQGGGDGYIDSHFTYSSFFLFSFHLSFHSYMFSGKHEFEDAGHELDYDID